MQIPHRAKEHFGSHFQSEVHFELKWQWLSISIENSKYFSFRMTPIYTTSLPPRARKLAARSCHIFKYLFINQKKDNIFFANSSPCEGTFWQPFPIRGPFWTQVTMTFDKHWKLAARLESRQWRRCFFYLLWTPSDRKRWRSSSCSLSRLQEIWI